MADDFFSAGVLAPLNAVPVFDSTRLRADQLLLLPDGSIVVRDFLRLQVRLELHAYIKRRVAETRSKLGLGPSNEEKTG